MIIFSRLNADTARLGNQLFRIASTIGIAIKNKQEYGFSNWEYAKYFTKPLPGFDENLEYPIINEKKFEHHEWNVKKGNFEIYGWLQTEKYFDIDIVKEQFTFKQEIVKKAIDPYKDILSKKTILMTVRRGDYINHPYFYQLSFKYYLLALIQNFPDWQERNILFTSDDMNYCKEHFSFLKNAYFINNTNPLEHMIIGSKCDDFIISNSTFSWFTAWLGEKHNTKVIRPKQFLRGIESKRKNDKDFFPDRWIKFDEDQYKLPLKYWRHTLKSDVTDYILDVKYFLNRVKNYIKRKSLK
ncbi:MAG: hypothetical protein ACI8RP_001409 [Urechidicola sp.]|jgi:hypothetical protein|tara:strand:- start:955 stop:1848 length:894 start_codon:yes stop_codon:yes gene_type:complete